jgi:ABC-type oligopeptide transport system substrate-binding subunit
MINRSFISFAALVASSIALVVACSFTAEAQTSSPAAPFSITPTNSLNLQIQNSAAQSGNLNRAKNLARQTAETANGGLNLYHAEALMHGPAAEAPFVDNGDGTYTFTFLGGKPGYTAPSVQSVVIVNTTDWSTRIDYNGVIRPVAAPSPASSEVVPR